MGMDRRDFVKLIAGTGATLAMSPNAFSQAEKKVDQINIIVIGAGVEGRILTDAARRIPGIRFKAICDIWEYHRKRISGRLRAYGHDVNQYEDYNEMLATEKDIDAAIIASPDWMHAEHTNACLNAGLHVYCEKEMSNSLEKARSMVDTARKTKKLLQIGHQRRSNPRYIHAFDTLLDEVNLLGRVTHANAMWNRSKTDDLGWPLKDTISGETLAKYGYKNMTEFRNWRWYKKYGGGPIVDLGSHQIDLFAWVFKANPKSVVASGGIDFYHHHEWYDNVMCIFEFENKLGTSRAFYQTLTTSKHGGFHETFMGENGTLVMSEVPAQGNIIEREEHAPQWDVLADKGLLKPKPVQIKKVKTKNTNIDVRVSAALGKWPLPIELAKPAHQPHLENFFDAIRLGVSLNCPGEIGYETAVAVLACNEAVRTNKKIEFKESDFHV